MKIRAIHTLILAIALAMDTSSRAQGTFSPLTDPTVPIMKTLEQIEPRKPISSLPFIIGTPGSYYLTGNLTGAAGEYGILIIADNVTLDLGGFDLAGPGSGGNYPGIQVTGGHSGVTVRNGSVHGWSSAGVSTTGTNLVVEDLRASGNAGGGIALGDLCTALRCDASGNTGGSGISGLNRCKVIGCTASSNSGTGIYVYNYAVVRDCVTALNGGDGIRVAANCVVTGCSAGNSGAAGFKGDGEGSTVSDCAAHLNTAGGFSRFAFSSLTNCSATSNTIAGFTLDIGGPLTNCSAGGNLGAGFICDASMTMHNCKAVANSGNGFTVGDRANLSDCGALNNTGAGFVGGDGMILHNCNSSTNGGNGFTVANGANLSGCSAMNDNGGYGIHTLDGCTIIGCTVRGGASSNSPSAGIFVFFGGRVSQCTVTAVDTTAPGANSSDGQGIFANSGSTVEHCTVRDCKGAGISAGDQSSIIANTCSGNGTATWAGIYVPAGIGARIEDNNVSGSYRGILVESNPNLIIKNNAYNNTKNYTISEGNNYGAIVELSGFASPAVNGSNAGTTLTTTDPWANFSH